MTTNQQENFWKLVTECLCHILRYEPFRARKEAQAYRKEIETACRRAQASNIIYHEIPVQVACDIAGQDLTGEYYSKFQKLLSEPAYSQKVITLTTPKKKPGRLRSTERELLPTGTSRSARKSAAGKRVAAIAKRNTKKVAVPRKRAR